MSGERFVAPKAGWYEVGFEATLPGERKKLIGLYRGDAINDPENAELVAGDDVLGRASTDSAQSVPFDSEPLESDDD